MVDTTKLKDMLDNLIDGKPEQAQTVFHNYLKDKINVVFGLEPTSDSTTQDQPKE